jgi:hypothetical protein
MSERKGNYNVDHPAMSPCEQAFNLIDGIRMALMSARIALLRDDAVAYRICLDQAEFDLSELKKIEGLVDENTNPGQK